MDHPTETPRVTSPLFAEFGGARVTYQAFLAAPLRSWADGVAFFTIDDQGGRTYIVDPDAVRALAAAAVQRQAVGELAAARTALSREVRP